MKSRSKCCASVFKTSEYKIISTNVIIKYTSNVVVVYLVSLRASCLAAAFIDDTVIAVSNVLKVADSLRFVSHKKQTIVSYFVKTFYQSQTLRKG
jgi:hypothetical protein